MQIDTPWRNPKVQAAILRAWVLAGVRGPKREAGFFILEKDGDYEIQEHPAPEQDCSISAFLPENCLAEVHVHPVGMNPEPSTKDREISENYGLPVFVISHKGLYVFSQHGLEFVSNLHELVERIDSMSAEEIRNLAMEKPQ